MDTENDSFDFALNPDHARKIAAPLPPPSADDPLAEWTQRMLAGMKRMTEDPEFRASIEKRLS